MNRRSFLSTLALVPGLVQSEHPAMCPCDDCVRADAEYNIALAEQEGFFDDEGDEAETR